MQIFIFLMVLDCSQHHTHELYLVLFQVTRPRLTRSQWQEITPGIHSKFSLRQFSFALYHLKLLFSLIYLCLSSDDSCDSYKIAYAFLWLSVTFISKKSWYSHNLQLLSCSVLVLHGSSLSHKYKSEGVGVANATVRINLILIAAFLNSWPGF